MFPVVEQDGGPVGPSQHLIFLLLHLAIFDLVWLKVSKARRYHSQGRVDTINKFLTWSIIDKYRGVKNTIKENLIDL